MERLFSYRFMGGLLLGIAFLLANPTLGQQQGQVIPDARLKAVIKPARLQKMIKKEPEKVLYLNYLLDHAWFISEGAKEKAVEGTDIHQVPMKGKKHRTFSEDVSVFSNQTFNPLKYKFRIDPVHYTFYPIGETGKVLVFYPQYIIDESFAKFLKNTNRK